MLNSALALELARAVVDERLRQAQHQALLRQLPAHPHFVLAARFGAFGRRAVASRLRSLAVRLDPSLDCAPAVAVLSSSR